MVTRMFLAVLFLLTQGGVLIVPVHANDYCPPVAATTDPMFDEPGYCECLAMNYNKKFASHVTIYLYTPDGLKTCLRTIPAKDYARCSYAFLSDGVCYCYVVGEGSLVRSSLVVRDSTWMPYVAVPCN